MSNANFLNRGDWNAICDRCGKKRKASTLKKTWDHLWVCADTCWEPRHEQDFLRGVPDDPSVSWTRPEATDSGGTDIEGNSTRYSGTCGPSNVAGFAIAGCAIAGNIKHNIQNL